jgi:hypothetical protein
MIPVRQYFRSILNRALTLNRCQDYFLPMNLTPYLKQIIVGVPTLPSFRMSACGLTGGIAEEPSEGIDD